MFEKLSWRARIALFVNLLALLGLVLGLLSSGFDPRTYVLSSLHSLSLPYFALLNLLFVGFWLAKLRWPFILSLIGLLAASPRLSSLVKLGSPLRPVEGEAVRLMSYNVRMFNRYKWIDRKGVALEIKELISAYAPDILCFQEYHENSNTPKFDYPTRHVLKLANGHTGELAIFSRYTEVKRGYLALGSKTGPEQRSMIYSDLIVQGDTLRLINVHLASLGLGNKQRRWMEGEASQDEDVEDLKTGVLEGLRRLLRSSQNRADEIDDLLEFIEKSPHPVMVCGDLNDVPGSYAFERIKRYGLSDSFEKAGRGLGETFAGSRLPLRIDAVWADSASTFVKHRVIRKKLSDHYPLAVDFIPRQKGVD